MNFLRFVVGMVVAAFACGPALAQNTIGELLAAGGKQLTKDEVKATLSGANVSGPSAAGGEWQYELKADGSISGYLTNANGQRGGVVGTWTVDDAGQVCRDFELRFRESRQVKDCSPVYRIRDEFFFPAASPSDPSTRLLKRTIKR